MKYAVIDVGSNSVRLLLESDGKTLYKGLNTTRLGEGLALSGKLSPVAMERTANAVRGFWEQSQKEGAHSVMVFATAAVRSATNGKDFVALVKQKTGLTVDVLSGEREAEIGLLGALEGKDGGILDVGGGSSELTLRINGKRAYSYSLDIGAVRIYDICGRKKEGVDRLLVGKLTPFLEAKPLLNKDSKIYAIGGTATSLAALKLRLKSYDGNAVQDCELDVTTLESLVDEIFNTTPEEITKNSCIPIERAEILGGGGMVILKTMKLLDINKSSVSEKDNLEGYLLTKKK